KGRKKYGKIKIKLTGNTKFDFEQAYKQAGIDSVNTKDISKHYTWHHLDDFDPITRECTMQLVRKDVHRASYKHIGGAGMFKGLIPFLYKERTVAFTL
ncbi:MAG: HNH endonuclease, partial [Aureispira sp.]